MRSEKRPEWSRRPDSRDLREYAADTKNPLVKAIYRVGCAIVIAAEKLDDRRP